MSETNKNQGLRTPISYYGGKQQMLKHILPVIPEHKIYIEPFFGGGAVFWANNPSPSEIINDVNMNVVNFYRVLKHQYFDLAKKIQETLHSRDTYKKALIIYECPWLFDDNPVVRAWAFYVVTNQGFATKIGTWGYDRDSKTTKSIQNKIDRFSEELAERLKNTQIEANEASKVIKSRDSKDAFVYADPPYVGTNQGHYGGYTEDHLRRDLDVLARIEGKFLLSMYPSDLIKSYANQHGWHTVEVDKPLSASNGAGLSKRKRKVEVLTANYEIKPV